jgi:hypothetical protein
MRLGVHPFADEQQAIAALLAEGSLPVGREGTRHFRNPERDHDRWVKRADVRRMPKGGQGDTRVHVWRAFT